LAILRSHEAQHLSHSHGNDDNDIVITTREFLLCILQIEHVHSNSQGTT